MRKVYETEAAEVQVPLSKENSEPSVKNAFQQMLSRKRALDKNGTGGGGNLVTKKLKEEVQKESANNSSVSALKVAKLNGVVDTRSLLNRYSSSNSTNFSGASVTESAALHPAVAQNAAAVTQNTAITAGTIVTVAGTIRSENPSQVVQESINAVPSAPLPRRTTTSTAPMAQGTATTTVEANNTTEPILEMQSSTITNVIAPVELSNSSTSILPTQPSRTSTPVLSTQHGTVSIPQSQSNAVTISSGSMPVSAPLTTQTVRGSWTPVEDAQVVAAVAQFGTTSWKMIARQVPGRSSKQCRDRYRLKLDPSINHGEWTDAEDKRLWELHQELQNKWTKISARMPGRTENAVKSRCATLIKQRMRNWQPDEDEILRECMASKMTYSEIVKTKMPYRTEHMVKKRWNQLMLADVADKFRKSLPETSSIPLPEGPTANSFGAIKKQASVAVAHRASKQNESQEDATNIDPSIITGNQPSMLSPNSNNGSFASLTNKHSVEQQQTSANMLPSTPAHSFVNPSKDVIPEVQGTESSKLHNSSDGAQNNMIGSQESDGTQLVSGQANAMDKFQMNQARLGVRSVSAPPIRSVSAPPQNTNLGYQTPTLRRYNSSSGQLLNANGNSLQYFPGPTSAMHSNSISSYGSLHRMSPRSYSAPFMHSASENAWSIASLPGLSLQQPSSITQTGIQSDQMSSAMSSRVGEQPSLLSPTNAGGATGPMIPQFFATGGNSSRMRRWGSYSSTDGLIAATMSAPQSPRLPGSRLSRHYSSNSLAQLDLKQDLGLTPRSRGSSNSFDLSKYFPPVQVAHHDSHSSSTTISQTGITNNLPIGISNHIATQPNIKSGTSSSGSTQAATAQQHVSEAAGYLLGKANPNPVADGAQGVPEHLRYLIKTNKPTKSRGSRLRKQSSSMNIMMDLIEGISVPNGTFGRASPTTTVLP